MDSNQRKRVAIKRTLSWSFAYRFEDQFLHALLPSSSCFRFIKNSSCAQTTHSTMIFKNNAIVLMFSNYHSLLIGKERERDQQ